jgi:hypothetical protein
VQVQIKSERKKQMSNEERTEYEQWLDWLEAEAEKQARAEEARAGQRFEEAA